LVETHEAEKKEDVGTEDSARFSRSGAVLRSSPVAGKLVVQDKEPRDKKRRVPYGWWGAGVCWSNWCGGHGQGDGNHKSMIIWPGEKEAKEKGRCQERSHPGKIRPLRTEDGTIPRKVSHSNLVWA